MKTTNRLLSGLFLAISASFLALPAFAQPGGDCGPMGGPMAGQMGGERAGQMRGERQQQHHEQLHQALKLNPEQEKAWATYQDSFKDMKPGQRPGQQDVAKLTAPERAEQMLEFSRKQQERMTQHVAALKTFYATLTPEQQKTFDAQQMQRGQRGQRQPGGKGPANLPAAN